MIKKSVGFTLIELLTVLTIAAIFLTLVVPGYRAIIQNNKVVGAINELSASFHLARIEAVKRGVPVVVCPTANDDYTACGTNSQWSNGWIVFLDDNSDNSIDATSDLLKVIQGTANDAQITTSSTAVSYSSTGFVSSDAASFVINAPGCTGDNARSLSITSSGRVSIETVACN